MWPLHWHCNISIAVHMIYDIIILLTYYNVKKILNVIKVLEIYKMSISTINYSNCFSWKWKRYILISFLSAFTAMSLKFRMIWHWLVVCPNFHEVFAIYDQYKFAVGEGFYFFHLTYEFVLRVLEFDVVIN